MSIANRHLLLSLFVSFHLLTSAFQTKCATLSGKVTNVEGESLPYATLYVEGSTKGTTTNLEGEYSIHLDPGLYTIVFQYLGYKKESFRIEIKNQNISLDVTLFPEVLKLKEVVVNSAGEDPAFEIIRQTIKRKSRYQKEIDAFQCQVYMKGLQRLDKKPSKLLGVNISLDTGIVYLSESISKLYFRRPNQVSEQMISSKVSGSQSSFSFNQASQTLFSVYDNILKVEGLTERGYISPLAKNALFYYNYKLEGIITEGGQMINKIRIYPKRKTDPTFTGYLYIVEDLWRVSKLELTLTKEHQLEFLDKLTVKQVHAQATDTAWVMLSQNFQLSFDVFGFTGSGYFSAVYSDYELELNPKYQSSKPPIDNTSIASRKSKLPFEFESIKDRNAKNEVLKIEKGANERSDEYWSNIRPIPLTAIEKYDYLVKDSLELFKNLPAYQDSVDALRNKITLGKLLYSGYFYEKTQKNYRVGLAPVIQSLQFNTIEGLLFNARLNYQKFSDKNVRYEFSPQLRYGLASRTLYGKGIFTQNLDLPTFESFSLEGGYFVSQFNQEEPITPFVNSIETLINRRNYMKLYEKTYLSASYQKEVMNGFHVKTKLSYGQRNQLTNQSDYSFFYNDRRNFTSNTPEHMTPTETTFTKHEAFKMEIGLSIRFRQKYVSLPDRKFIIDNKYPKINLLYTKALDILGSQITYDQIQLTLDDDIKLGLIGTSEVNIGTGIFIKKGNGMFMDYKHFNTNASILARFEDDYFQLMDYYFYSTNNYWLEGHLTHHFDGFIVNKIPLLRRTKVQAVGSLHYLHTEDLESYFEIGAGIEHIFKVFRMDYTHSIGGDKQILERHAIRLGMGF